MEACIPISLLNDFVFCPRSVYFHRIYESFDSRIYHTDVQVKGRTAHMSIDENKYSTRKNILHNLPVFSSQYSLCGRTDIFDKTAGILTERKKRVRLLYDGFIFQAYAQYYCLTEMGYPVRKIFIYSKDDNKNHPIPLPLDNPEGDKKFKNLLEKIHSFNLEDDFSPNIKKCVRCIYRHLCDKGPSPC